MSALRQHLPVESGKFRIARDSRVGLVIVDEVNGFCTPGAGNLAPPVRDEQIETMVSRTSLLANDMLTRGMPVLAFLDTHEADKPEPPYPPHCVRGTGEEKLVEALAWLEKEASRGGEAAAAAADADARVTRGSVTLMEKDCINGFVGGMQPDGTNIVTQWAIKHQLEHIIVVGICTDICVMDFVLTALSARNHGLFGQQLKEIVVVAPACSTYNLPRPVAESLGRGATASHPQDATHHLGLYFMHSRALAQIPPLTWPGWLTRLYSPGADVAAAAGADDEPIIVPEMIEGAEVVPKGPDAEDAALLDRLTEMGTTLSEQMEKGVAIAEGEEADLLDEVERGVGLVEAMAAQPNATLSERAMIMAQALLQQVEQAEAIIAKRMAAGSSVASVTSAREGILATVPLDKSIKRTDLNDSFLNYHKTIYPGQVKLRCMGEPCPNFGSCGDSFPTVRACFRPEFADEIYYRPDQPENCPKLSHANESGELGADPRCTHKTDHHWHDAMVFQLFELRGMFINVNGLVFNRSLHFDRHGCFRDLEFDYKAGESQVMKLHRVVSLAYNHAVAFYHSLVEFFPQFLMLADLLRANPDIPILFRRSQLAFYNEMVKHLVGLETTQMNLIVVEDTHRSKLIHADVVYQPVYQGCGKPSPSLWRHLRLNYLLPPDGLPLFSSPWRLRAHSPGPWSDARAAVLPSNWVVVMARRPGNTRKMVGFEGLLEAVEGMFGKDRVVVFNGSIPILEARALFNRAAVYIASHGAAMANLVFMPSASCVLEIRPRDYLNACYHHLASASQQKYFLVFGNGTKDTPLEFHLPDVLPVLKNISDYTMMRVREQEEDPLLEEGREWVERLAEGGGKSAREMGFVTPIDEGSVKEGTMPEDFIRAEMDNLHLNMGSTHSPNMLSLECPGNSCPDFSGSCDIRPDASACTPAAGWRDEGFPKPPVPVNCPKEDRSHMGPEGRNESCTHAADFFWFEWQIFQVYKLRNVYINDEGLMFNKTTHFHREGCNWDSEFQYKKGTKIKRIKRVVNLVYRQASSFYHGLIEWTPQLLLLASTLHTAPTLPLLAHAGQWDFYQHVAQPLLGNDLSKTAILNISDGEIYFAEEVYVPLYQACGKASPSIWTDIRHRFLLPPKGLPMFRNNQWDVRHVSALDSKNASVVPPDWLVVVARRPGVKRALEKFDELLESIKRIFGHTRVQVFDGSLPILHARNLFRRARLFVAGHGAAMANMVFMPANATVLEIRPDKYENACYHHLAYACELRYYLTFGKGDFESQVQADLAEVSGILQGIKDGFAPLPGEEHPNFS
ncbi:unnamed protein product [Closterium sp. NIES-64]|nr:unnamed protein product [Closterium sp. NIES-64]